MSYKDMSAGAPYQLTAVNHATYMATHQVSPWHVVPGWSLSNNVFDIMHNLFLGSGRIFIGSALRLMLEHGVFDSYGAERDSPTMFAHITLEIQKDYHDVKFLDFEFVLERFNCSPVFPQTK